jgi:hypothetical protein
MIFGWMPKLPSCPIPLTYKNEYVDSVKRKIKKYDLYKIIYQGPRLINSVKVNKNNSYRWKYR